MQMLYHGGAVCGIKTIHDFNFRPDFVIPALDKATDAVEFDGSHNNAGKRWYRDAAPAESRLERLDRYIKFADDSRTGICLEVVLMKGYQTNSWETLLFERGFVMVNEFQNSNTIQTLRIYHRVTKNKEIVTMVPAQKVDTFTALLQRITASFDTEPASTPYQLGYLACAKDLLAGKLFRRNKG